MVHPEIEPYVATTMSQKSLLEPVYSTTEKLKARGLNAKQIGKLTQTLFQQISDRDVPENLPSTFIRKQNGQVGGL